MAEATVGSLHWGDIIVIIIYFIVVLVVGLWSSCNNRGSVKGYFLAGGNMHWIPVGASLFASNIGSGHFIGLAGSGAATGIGIAAFELNAIFVLMILGWIFVPVYTNAKVFTMPEYLWKRFGGSRIRVYLSVLSLLLYVFTKMSADLYSGAIFINLALPVNIYVAVIILLLVAAVFTIGGGLTAVIWTDFVQTIIMVIGAFILMILGFIKVGGYEALVTKYFAAVSESVIHSNTSCGFPPPYSMKSIRGIETALPWPGIMFGLTISSVWYWCTDQVIVQRALAAKNRNHVKGGTIFAGYLKFLPLWIMVFPGMMARVLFTEDVACVDPDKCMEVCGSASGCTNIAYPKLVLEIMPVALRGFMLAVMMAALISSLTSIFNSTSTIFTIDIWKRIRKSATDIELMIVGRVCVLVLVGVSIAWIPIVQNAAELFHYIQAITSYLAPPVCAVFVLAVFWKRINEQGAFWSLMIGLVVGLSRFIWEFTYTVPPCTSTMPDPRPSIIKDVHYLHFGIILFVIVVIAAVSISLVTEPLPEGHVVGLTFWERNLAIKDNPNVQNEKPAVSTKHYKGAESYAGKALEWICGIEKMVGQPDGQPSHERQEGVINYAYTKWSHICDANAAVLMVLAIVLWAFYA